VRDAREHAREDRISVYVRGMRTLLVMVVVTACGSSTPPPAPPAPAEPPAGSAFSAPAAPHVETRQIVMWSRPSGHYTITTASDGTITAVYDVLDNGRGPHVEATLRLAADKTLASFAAKGHHTMGTAVDETFARTGDHGRWKSTEEAGEADAHRATFYYPLADLDVAPWLVPAALAGGGTLALWPSGEVKVAKVAEQTVHGRSLVCYAMTGLDMLPVYTWFESNGDWFGTVAPGFSELPDGFEQDAAGLVATQQALDAKHSEELARTTQHVPPPAGFAFTHARVLDVVRGAWLPDQTVLVVGDKIAAIGPHVKLDPAVEVRDLGGKALIPGLVDMHSHTYRELAVMDIAAGVTTARDVGNVPDVLDDLKAHFDARTAVGPQMVRMGFIEGRGEKAAASVVTAETPDEAKAAVELFAQRHYEGIKIYNSVKVELVPLLAAEAHKRGMLVTGHIPVHMLAHEAVEAGYDGIEHINMLFLNFLATHETDTRDTTRFKLVGDHATELDLNGKPVRDFIAELRAHHTVIDPTLGAFEDLFLGVPGQMLVDEGYVKRLPITAQRSFLEGGLPLAPETHAKYVQSWAQILAMVKLLWQSKIPLVAGTDSGYAGLALHHELDLLASAGIPTADVLRMATIDAARAMKMDKVFGTIERGKRADLVVVDGDPLADLGSLRHVEQVMRAGVLYESAPLWQSLGVEP
jgi:imidazolonepropionase-like amidohydrolase